MNERSGRRLRRWRNNLAIHLLPNEGEREREKEKVRSMPLHRNAATCYSTSFLPPGEKFRGEGIGFVYAKRGTPCRDLGRRTMGVMEVTKEERANSNDRATIEPPPRSIGRRHWFPPVYQLHRSFLLFFFFLLLLLLFFLLFDEWTSNAVGKLVIQGGGWGRRWGTFAGD